MDNSKSIYDKIEEKNYANIVAKLKDGKTLEKRRRAGKGVWY